MLTTCSLMDLIEFVPVSTQIYAIICLYAINAYRDTVVHVNLDSLPLDLFLPWREI